MQLLRIRFGELPISLFLYFYLSIICRIPFRCPCFTRRQFGLPLYKLVKSHRLKIFQRHFTSKSTHKLTLGLHVLSIRLVTASHVLLISHHPKCLSLYCLKL